MASQDDRVFTIGIPSGVSSDDVRNCVLLSLSNRRWSADEKADGSIEAELVARGIHGHVVITYDDKSITIEDHSTDHEDVPFVPIRWIRYLMRDIRNHMIKYGTIS